MILEKIYRNLDDGINNLNSAFGKDNPLKPNLLITLTAEEAETLRNLLGSCEIAKKSEIVDEHAYKTYGKDIENHIKHQIASDLSEFLLDKIFFVNSVDHEKMLVRYDGYMVVGDAHQYIKHL